MTSSHLTAQAPEASIAVGSDLTTKAAAWDGAVASNQKGYERGVKAALQVISGLRLQYTPAPQGRVRFSVRDLDRAFKGGLDLAREDIAKLLADAGPALTAASPDEASS